MRIFSVFVSACKAPAIILILSSPDGSYYSIQIKSLRLLHFLNAASKTEKKREKIAAIRKFHGGVTDHWLFNVGPRCCFRSGRIRELLTHTKAQCTVVKLAPVQQPRAHSNQQLFAMFRAVRTSSAPQALTGCCHSHLEPQAWGRAFE